MIVDATYVSVWDGGTEIHTSCKWDIEKQLAFDIDSASGGNVDVLDREYVLLPDGTEIDVDRELEFDGGIPAAEHIPLIDEYTIRYVWDVTERKLIIYYGTPGLVWSFITPLSGSPAAIKLAKIHGIKDFSVRYSRAEDRNGAEMVARIISTHFLKYDVPVIDATWGEDENELEDTHESTHS